MQKGCVLDGKVTCIDNQPDNETSMILRLTKDTGNVTLSGKRDSSLRSE
ncbi:MAG: hypothetical protein ACK41Q_09860 [Candidatus Brocadia sp.]